MFESSMETDNLLFDPASVQLCFAPSDEFIRWKDWKE